MKRLLFFMMVLVSICGLSGCKDNAPEETPGVEESVSADYGKVIELAKEEFNEIFKEFENLKIEETTTMARTDDAKEIVVQIEYSSNNGSGVYGFLYNLDDYANPELIEHGQDVTIDNLFK